MSADEPEDSDDLQPDHDPDDEPTTALVEVQPGLAVLYGDHVPDGMDLVPFELLDGRTHDALADSIAKASGLGNLAAQGVNGVMHAQGLVRLAPETLKALQTAKPVVSGGWNLGTLATANGKFATSVRWLPATGANAASVAASIGPALAMVAIQMQLSQISKLAQHNLEISQIALAESRRTRRSQVQGHHWAVLKMLRLAQEQGSVSPAIYTEVRGKLGDLESQVDEIRDGLGVHVGQLQTKTSNKDRRRYLADHGEEILALAHCLLMAQSTKFVYQALWAGYLLDTATEDPRNEVLAQRVIEEGIVERDAALSETDDLLSLAEREFGVMAELDGKRAVTFGGEARAGKDVATMARQLRAVMADIRGQSRPREFARPEVPATTVFKKEVPADLPRILAFRLTPDERVLAMAEANVDPLSLVKFFSSWVIITTHRLLIANKDSFKRFAQIRQSVPLHEIRYVRLVEREKGKGPGLDIVTAGQNIRLVFDDWASSGPALDQARRFARILGSFMRLPEEEIPTADIPELESTDTRADPAPTADSAEGDQTDEPTK